jgi:hypothetical protein
MLASFVRFDVADLRLQEGLRLLGLALVNLLLQERHLAFQRLVIAEAARFPRQARAGLRHL